MVSATIMVHGLYVVNGTEVYLATSGGGLSIGTFK